MFTNEIYANIFIRKNERLWVLAKTEKKNEINKRNTI